MSEIKNTKIFPQGKQQEFSLLAMMIRYPKNIDTTIYYGVDIDCFYNKISRILFTSLMSLYNRKQWIDTITLTDEANKIDPEIKHSQIEALVNTKAEHSENLEAYIKQLISYKNLRYLLEELKRAEDTVLSDIDYDEKFSTIQTSIAKIYGNNKEDLRNYNEKDNFDFFMDYLQANVDSQGKNVISSGFKGYDAQVSLTNGIHIFAGIPGTGKTALLQQIIKYIASQGKNIFVYSIEMEYVQLMMRQVQTCLGIPIWKQHAGALTKEELAKIRAFKDTLSDNVTYNDLGKIDIEKLKSIARIANSKKKINVIAIDYLQKISAKGFKHKHEEYEYIVLELSALAKELQVPILCLAQLNREWKKNDSGIPEASNIAGTKKIEEEAVSITFIHRPGQIDKTYPDQSETYFYFAKNRYGNSNTVKMKFNGELCRFEEIDSPYIKTTPLPVKTVTAKAVVEDDLDDNPFDEPLFDKSMEKVEDIADLFATPPEELKPKRKVSFKVEKKK